MAELVVILDKQIIKRLTVKSTNLNIGRGNKCDVVLPDRTISTEHARIRMVRDDCFLEDLKSTNGTYVNNHIVDQHYLEDGDIIGLGKYQIVFRAKQSVKSQLQRLGIHPRMMDTSYHAWLKVVEGKKAGYVIPLQNGRVVLGSLDTLQTIIEANAKGEYIIRQMGEKNPHPPRKLLPDEEFKVEDVLLQFCVN